MAYIQKTALEVIEYVKRLVCFPASTRSAESNTCVTAKELRSGFRPKTHSEYVSFRLPQSLVETESTTPCLVEDPHGAS